MSTDTELKVYPHDRMKENETPRENSPKSQKRKFTSSPRFPRWVGNHLILFHYRGYPYWTIGPHWQFFLGLFSFLFVVSLLLLKYVTSDNTTKLYYVTLLISFLTLGSYILTSLNNPGIVTARYPYRDSRKNSNEDMEMHRENSMNNHNGFCHQCEIFRRLTTYHCQDCEVCIESYDHHCPWSGKCIGKGNIKQFNAFLCMMALFFIYALTITFFKGILYDTPNKTSLP